MTTTVGPALGQGAVMNQATSYDAISFRRAFEGIVAEGIISAGSFAVSQRAAGANLSVDIAASTGSGARIIGDAVTLQGPYYVAPHASVINETIATAHATLPRNDLVILEIKDTAHDASGSSLAQTRVVTGTATAGAAATDDLGVNGTPTLPASSIPLAVVNVPATDTAITDGQIDDRRPKTSGGYSGGKTIIATEESRTNTAYGLLTTPDRVRNVVLPTDGLIAISYQAMWKESVIDAARVAIFVGANQLKRPSTGTVPVVQDAGMTGIGTANVYNLVAASHKGLVSAASSAGYTGDVTTGQIMGGATSADQFGGPCYVFAAAGTYDISVQFKASSGSVTAKERKLRVWVQPF